MIDQPIETGLLSFGMSGRLFHAPFLHAHPGLRFSAVTERHAKKANRIYPGVKSHDTTDSLIEDPSLELIVVNTPNDSHYQYAKKALTAGKHVLIEKPFATSIGEARELFRLGQERGLHVMAYQNRRWDSDFLSVKQVLETQKLGKLVEAHFRFDRYKTAIEQKAFKEEPIPGSGLSWNLGPHPLDQVISLFGRPLRSYKTTSCNRIGSKVDDYAFFHLIYPEGLHVYVHVSLLVAAALPAFVIHGRNGSFIKERADVQEKQLNEGVSPFADTYGLEPPGAEGWLTLFDANGQKTTERTTSVRGNYAGLFDAVYAQLRKGKSFPVTREQILCQVEILGQQDV